MTKTTRALSGASKDAYFRAVFDAEADLSANARERLLGQLQKGVTQVRIRTTAVSTVVSQDEACAPDERAPAEDANFDPFTPNVLVAVRRDGAAGALALLSGVANPAHLRLLAREQQLSIADEITDAQEMARAIVAAAERRIANMRAAAR